MKPITAVFHKEFRQHGAFALAMVVLCLLFQITTYEWSAWFNDTVAPEMYLFIALVVAALYAGAAAALAYSTEHADNTYTFLRKLPVSTAALALGKIGWVLCGTTLVLLANTVLAAAWTAGYLSETIFIAFGVAIVEFLVWGLFWSTRCRSQVHAIIAGYVCASFTAWLIANMFVRSNHNDPAVLYLSVVPQRLAFLGIIALFALWGALRWFRFDARDGSRERNAVERPDHGGELSGRSVSLRSRLSCVFRYPQRVQRPFFALVHQHVRHASILYPLGIAAFVIFSLGCLCLLLVRIETKEPLLAVWSTHITAILIGTMLFFWGNIFGHDQKNDSYRFLSRLGIHEGKVWWSRMLPAILLYIPVLLCVFVSMIVADIREFVDFMPFIITVWLAPLAVGAFVSISFRSQMVAIALTIGGTLTLLGWAMIFYTLFGCSPLWTTVPIALALLLASRLRATYWLRETYTWRSRLMPLLPFFVVMLAIFTALPLVRIYSVPYVSWWQIDHYFDFSDLGDIPRDREKRKALLRHIAEHGTVPPEYESILKGLNRCCSNTPLPEGLTYEEFLLLRYVEHWRYYNMFVTGQFDGYDIESMRKEPLYYARYMPWEKARNERALRLWLVATLFQSSNTQWYVDENFFKFAYANRKMWDSNAAFDERHYVRDDDALRGRRWNSQPLGIALNAVTKWYREHESLPESLDDLVGTYLDKLPVHHFTLDPVRYYVNAPPPQNIRRIGYNINFYTKSGKHVTWEQRNEKTAAFAEHGGTYLILGRQICVLLEPEDVEQDETTEPQP